MTCAARIIMLTNVVQLQIFSLRRCLADPIVRSRRGRRREHSKDDTIKRIGSAKAIYKWRKRFSARTWTKCIVSGNQDLECTAEESTSTASSLG